MPHFTYNNHQLFYREQGAGPLLLILPGNSASSACHDGELAYFSRRYHPVSLDFLGTGQSDRLVVWPDDWWQQGAYQARALLAHLRQPRCLVMGASGGAVVALWLAIFFPETVQAVIADSCGERFSPQLLQQNVLAERARRTSGQVAFWRHAHGDDWSQVVAADSDLLTRFARQGGDWFKGRLREIGCPVLFTASKVDNALPDVATEVCHMAAQVVNSRVFINNEGEHPFMWSRPEDFRHVSDYFLKRVL